MRYIDAGKTGTLNLGYAGEKDRTTVLFPIGDLQAEFPGGAVVLKIRRPWETDHHDILPTIDGDTAKWLVGDYDLETRGEGECVLVYSDGSAIAKRKVWETRVCRSNEGESVSIPPDWEDIEGALVTAAGEVVHAIETAGTTATQAAEAAEAAKLAAETAQEKAETAQGKAEEAQTAAETAVGQYNDMTVTITTLAEGSQATAEIDHTGDAPVLRLGVPIGATGATGVGISGIAFNSDYTLTITLSNGNSYTTTSIRGAQGETGQTGPQGVGIYSIAKTGASGLVDTYTITFTNNQTTTFTVTNGQDGNAVIDDTKGVGDTTYVWSASKSATVKASQDEEIENLKGDIAQETTAQDILDETEGIHELLDGFLDLSENAAKEETAQEILDVAGGIKEDLEDLIEVERSVRYYAELPTTGTEGYVYITPDGVFYYDGTDFISCAGSGSLNGFSFVLNASNQVVVTYTNPEDETDSVSVTVPGDTTGQTIVAELHEINGLLQTIAGGNE